MSSHTKSLVALREIQWKTLILGDQYPEDFDGGNWTSAPGSSYPIDIVLGLPSISNVYKVTVDVGDTNIPTEISIAVGLRDVQEQINYRNARNAKFEKPTKMQYHRRDGASRMESKTAYTDNIGQYIWIQINSSIEHRNNPSRQVTVKKVRVFGYPLPDEEVEAIQTGAKIVEKNETYQPPPQTPQRGETPIYKPETERPSYEGDGMETNNFALTGDPLTCLRTVKRTIQEKKKRAEKSGKEIEATVCLRAIQRLAEYEARIEKFAEKRSDALAKNDHTEAERFGLLMADCRDTVFRSIHVDLLLDTQSLRAIGVQSQWSTSPEN